MTSVHLGVELLYNNRSYRYIRSQGDRCSQLLRKLILQRQVSLPISSLH
ncbi:hypothetical protein Krac_7987 [Ktedonobacter racemifer DSM 44963]|uniref:Uncharacterized protein n=1 Tax=Ktedonobacter racemifer DSM 44963 TaxID=485913 RepID=D6TLM6_KTERA|nr:hypothetical protein Krac_7987 [Ktedonobacter racemifer DSM 44963]